MSSDIRADWDESKLELCKPEYFHVKVSYNEELFSEDVRVRMSWKLDLVSQLAAKLAANMLKGTLKYTRDDWTVAQWLDYLADDAADTLNYVMLLSRQMKLEVGGLQSI